MNRAVQRAGTHGRCERGFGTGDRGPGKACTPGVARRSLVPGTRSPLARGFTLLEVLAAIALLAIAFAIGLGALGKSAQNAGRSAALDTAVEHAQGLLAEQGLAKPLDDGTLSGTFADGMHWTLDIHALPGPAAGPGGGAALQQQGALLAQPPGVDLYQLDVAVQYGAGRVLRLSTQRAQAAPSANGE
ncbi:MAG TPA: prepilin-type N-terminal cleavage/methylation domain-containing protein [Rhodanobacteraceae bacterium]|nr:prepilin-type N-terminal cleavage/methylation domain-containing protein [Rhodanobacteraceae bacterium]